MTAILKPYTTTTRPKTPYDSTFLSLCEDFIHSLLLACCQSVAWIRHRATVQNWDCVVGNANQIWFRSDWPNQTWSWLEDNMPGHRKVSRVDQFMQFKSLTVLLEYSMDDPAWKSQPTPPTGIGLR
jgi:hypothetical protein